jgi:hypothetical protein
LNFIMLEWWRESRAMNAPFRALAPDARRRLRVSMPEAARD